jgi:hypothetical protein
MTQPKWLQGDKLTGRIRFRVGWRGCLVLQLEEHSTANEGTVKTTRWRDALATDMSPLAFVG